MRSKKDGRLRVAKPDEAWADVHVRGTGKQRRDAETIKCGHGDVLYAADMGFVEHEHSVVLRKAQDEALWEKGGCWCTIVSWMLVSWMLPAW